MKCPHCAISIHDNAMAAEVCEYPRITGRVDVPRVRFYAWHQRCPECYNEIVFLERTINFEKPGAQTYRILAYPQASLRPVQAGVPESYCTDFLEACAVLSLSPKASAAISRRCVQAVLRDQAKTTKKDLYDQIEEVVNSGRVPSYIAEALHAVRNIGNFGAHPLKSTNTGEVLEVEPGEAEWNLDVLESLFDFYFVQPALTKARKDALNERLKEAGKPLLK